jgi:hypothetical protein
VQQQEPTMSARLSFIFSFALVVFASPALAQSPAQPMPSRSIALTAEQSHMIKEIVLKDMKVTAASGVGEVKIGEPAPDNVELHAFSNDVIQRVAAIKSHKFFVVGDHIVIVDPKDNTVADVLQ